MFPGLNLFPALTWSRSRADPATYLTALLPTRGYLWWWPLVPSLGRLAGSESLRPWALSPSPILASLSIVFFFFFSCCAAGAVLHGLPLRLLTSVLVLIPLAPGLYSHCNCFVDNWPKKSCFLLSLMLVSNDVPTWRGRRRNLILAIFRNWFFHSLLSCNPLPIKFGWVGQERSNLRPPPTCRVKEELIQFTQN